MDFSWNSFVSKVKETTDIAGDLLQEAATQAAPHLEKFSGDVKSLAGKAAVAAKDLAERVEREVGPVVEGVGGKESNGEEGRGKFGFGARGCAPNFPSENSRHDGSFDTLVVVQSDMRRRVLEREHGSGF